MLVDNGSTVLFHGDSITDANRNERCNINLNSAWKTVFVGILR